MKRIYVQWPGQYGTVYENINYELGRWWNGMYQKTDLQVASYLNYRKKYCNATYKYVED